MSKSLIFKDRSKLSPYFIPEKLPHRDTQIKRLMSIYGETIDSIGSTYPRVTQILGNTGSGKTSTVMRFGELITRKTRKESIDFSFAYVNCKVDGTTRYVLYGNLLKKVVPALATRSLSPEEMLHQLADYLKREIKFLLIAFDEIDYFIKMNPKEHIIYDLTRMSEMYPGQSFPIIGLIFISRSLDWHQKLEPGEKSTLGIGVIEFPNYTSSQIRDILELRAKDAFWPGVVDDDVLNLISDVTAKPPVNGDARVGLDLLFYSGNLAESQSAKRILPDHVRKVFSETNPTIRTEDLVNLDENSRMILLALVRNLQLSGSAYVGLRDIRESYNLVCEEFDANPVGDFEERVQDLVFRGIVDMKSLTELGVSGASSVDIDKFLSSLIDRLRQGLDEK